MFEYIIEGDDEFIQQYADLFFQIDHNKRFSSRLKSTNFPIHILDTARNALVELERVRFVYYEEKRVAHDAYYGFNRMYNKAHKLFVYHRKVAKKALAHDKDLYYKLNLNVFKPRTYGKVVKAMNFFYTTALNDERMLKLLVAKNLTKSILERGLHSLGELDEALNKRFVTQRAYKKSLQQRNKYKRSLNKFSEELYSTILNQNDMDSIFPYDVYGVVEIESESL